MLPMVVLTGDAGVHRHSSSAGRWADIYLVLDQVGLPVEGIGLIIGVDRLLDMLRTVVNVTGDGTVATIVAKSED